MLPAPSIGQRRAHVLGWLLASFASLAAVVFCFWRWFIPTFCHFASGEEAYLCESPGYWGHATLVCIAACFACALRLAGAGRKG